MFPFDSPAPSKTSGNLWISDVLSGIKVKHWKQWVNATPPVLARICTHLRDPILQSCTATLLNDCLEYFFLPTQAAVCECSTE